MVRVDGRCPPVALYINGSWRRTPLFRVAGAGLGLIWWLVLGFLFKTSADGGPLPAGLMWFPVFILFEGYMVRGARDAYHTGHCRNGRPANCRRGLRRDRSHRAARRRGGITAMVVAYWSYRKTQAEGRQSDPERAGAGISALLADSDSIEKLVISIDRLALAADKISLLTAESKHDFFENFRRVPETAPGTRRQLAPELSVILWLSKS